MSDAASFNVNFLVVLLFVFTFSWARGKYQTPTHLYVTSRWSEQPSFTALFSVLLPLLRPQIKVTKLIAQVRVENITCTGEAFTYLNF